MAGSVSQTSTSPAQTEAVAQAKPNVTAVQCKCERRFEKNGHGLERSLLVPLVAYITLAYRLSSRRVEKVTRHIPRTHPRVVGTAFHGVCEEVRTSPRRQGTTNDGGQQPA